MAHKTRIMYVELAQAGHRGSAKICRVRYSKSGRTIYVGGLALRPCSVAARPNGRVRSGVYGNYLDPMTQTEYWVSGPKKNGGDRHWSGGGEVRVDADVVDEYWHDIRGCAPPHNPFVA